MSKPLKERLKAIKPALVVKPPAPVVVVPTPEPGFLELMRDVQPLRPDNRASLPRPLPSPHPRPRNETMACPAAHEAFASWFDEDQSAADFVRNGVPRDIFKRMRTRHWPIASREDLHGHDRDAAEARLLQVITPWLVGKGNEEPASQILALLGERSLHLQEGESRGALLTMCHGYPALTAGFSHTLSDDLTQLAVPAAPLSLTIGRAGPDGVPLLLCADGQLHGQTLRVSHPDPASGRRILAFAALDMLRRHLLGLPVLADYLTLTRTARGQEGARG